ncbi:unnamed protein product [Closterium sp. NIES-54]
MAGLIGFARGTVATPEEFYPDLRAEFCADVPSPFPSPAPPAPLLIVDLRGQTPMSASGDEGRSGTLPSAPAKSIAGGRRDEQQVDVGVKSTSVGEEQAEEVQPPLVKLAKKGATREQAAAKPTKEQSATGQSAGELTIGEKSAEMPIVIVAILNLNVMHLDMKNAFLHSKLDRVLYMYQPDYFNGRTGRVCMLLKSLYGLKQLSLLWYKALNDVLVGAGWKKSQVDTALYFKMLKELKELLEAAFELREISPVQKYLGLRRRFIDEEQTGRTPKTPVLVDAYAELTFNDEEAQERQEEEYWQKVGSLHFAATTTTSPSPAASWGAASRVAGAGRLRGRRRRRRQAEPDEHGWLRVCLRRGRSLLVESAHQVHDAVVDRVRVPGGHGSWQGRTPPSLPPRRVPAAGSGKPTVLRVDNNSAITVAEGMGLTGNLKHMERQQAWLQQMVKHGKFSLKYIPTAEQPSDFQTKALHYPAFNQCSVAIGQVRLANVGDDDDDVQQ